MVYRVAVRASYDVALFIPGDVGAAGRTHGHGYTVEAVLESERLAGTGFVVDFDWAEGRLAAIAAELDHRVLNELAPFEGIVPSAEAQAEFFFGRLREEVTTEYGENVRVSRVRVTQMPDAWAEYEP
jgi:6-pyruvoyltetrahydropterin/6-carboxytetrahydropterin synthase